MKRTRSQGRSGLFRKLSPAEAGQSRTTTPDEIMAALGKAADSWTTESVFASAFDIIEQMEAQAVEVYARYGLPTAKGAYFREAPGSPWLARSRAPAPGEKCEVTGLSQPLGCESGHLSEIAKFDHPTDSEPGFAATLLHRAESARHMLNRATNAGPAGVAVAFNSGVDLILAWTQWREEFGLAGYIEPERAQRRSRSAGGKANAARILTERAPDWAEWRAEAESIWGANPSLSKKAVALAVIRKLSLEVGERAVRNQIKKPERR